MGLHDVGISRGEAPHMSTAVTATCSPLTTGRECAHAGVLWFLSSTGRVCRLSSADRPLYDIAGLCR